MMSMNIIRKRALSTLIPPKVVSAKQLGTAPNAKRVANMVKFYQALPQGRATTGKSTGLVSWYKAKYFDGNNASGKPLLHLCASILIIGYSIEYYFHLRHHKGDHH